MVVQIAPAPVAAVGAAFGIIVGSFSRGSS
jgi:hypothetical protein